MEHQPFVDDPPNEIAHGLSTSTLVYPKVSIIIYILSGVYNSLYTNYINGSESGLEILPSNNRGDLQSTLSGLQLVPHIRPRLDFYASYN